jgi:hypothetical protein
MQKRTLFVGLSRPRKFKVGSFLIRFVEGNWGSLYPASHAFSITPSHPGRPFYLVNEAAGSMVRFVSQPHFEDHAEITALYRFEFDKPTYNLIRTYGELHAGAPYAFLENLGIAFVRVAKLFGKAIPNPFGSGEGAQKCTELVIRNIVSRVASLKDLQTDLYNERGHLLPADIESMGVRDIFEILEFLADGNLCERADLSTSLRIVKLSGGKSAG